LEEFGHEANRVNVNMNDINICPLLRKGKMENGKH
jgi:hypothetical protein